jgi:hypothetical protein
MPGWHLQHMARDQSLRDVDDGKSVCVTACALTRLGFASDLCAAAGAVAGGHMGAVRCARTVLQSEVLLELQRYRPTWLLAVLSTASLCRWLRCTTPLTEARTEQRAEYPALCDMWYAQQTVSISGRSGSKLRSAAGEQGEVRGSAVDWQLWLLMLTPCREYTLS